MKKISKFLLFLLAFSPAFAFAGPFDPPPTDISVLVLNQIFGGLLQGGQNAFGESIKTFNSIILSLGGILAAYTILAGTLGTAHDGEMLGKKFSSVWIPIRYSLGTALVLPVIPGGYCVMQQIVMWLVLQGVGLADIVWTSYVGAPIGSLTAKMNNSNKQNVLKFAEHVALASGCTYAAASIYNAGSSTVSTLLQPINAAPNFTMKHDVENGKYYFGNQATIANIIMNNKKQCGEITLPGAVDKDIAKFYGTVGNKVGASAPSGGKLGAINIAFATPSTEPIYLAHTKAADAVIQKINTAAQNAVASETAIPYSIVIKSAEEYINSVEVASATYVSGSNDSIAKLKEQSSQQGWFLAGAWYTRLTMLNYHIQQSVNMAPKGESSTSLGSVFNFLDSINPAIEKVQGEILVKNGQSTNISNAEKDEGDSKDGEKSANTLVNKLINSFTGIDIKELNANEKPPVIILQEAGDALIDMWMNTMLLLLDASILSLLSMGAATPIFITIIGFIAAPAAALVGIGFTLGYMLPNLPFLMWIGVILGWLIMVIEAILAAPLWAIMHLHPNGDDLTGKGANGYMLVLGLTLRPVLTVFGLIAALVVTDLMGEFVNKIFFSVFQIGNAGGIKGFLVIFFSFSIYTMSQFSLFKKTFSLMHVIPDQLLRWIGGGGEQLGQYAGSIADGAGRAQGAIAAASSFAGEKAVSSLGNSINLGKQIKDNKDNKKLSEKSENLQLNNKFGEGTSEQASATIQNGAKNGAAGGALGWLGKQNNNKMRSDKAAYNSGLERSAAAGGQDGVEEYQKGMSEASENGYEKFGGTIEGAAKGVAANVEQTQLNKQVSTFNSEDGNEASAFMQKVAGTPSGKIDAKRAAPALALLNQGREVLGSTELANVLEQASRIPDRSKAREHVQKSVAEAKFAKTSRKHGVTGDIAAELGEVASIGAPVEPPLQSIDSTDGTIRPPGQLLNSAESQETVNLAGVSNAANNGITSPNIVNPATRIGDVE